MSRMHGASSTYTILHQFLYVQGNYVSDATFNAVLPAEL